MKGDVQARPGTGSLSFCAFDQPLHPELIEARETHTFVQHGCVLRLHLTAAGHVVEWRHGEVVVVEVLHEQGAVLPGSRQLFSHRLGAERGEFVRLAERVSYRTRFQVERLPSGVYAHVHAELRNDADRDGVLHLFQPSDRLGFAPISFVNLQSRPGSFVIHAYHTFPSELAIVKTQSLLEIDGR